MDQNMEVYHNGYVLWDKGIGRFVAVALYGPYKDWRESALNGATIFPSREAAQAIKDTMFATNTDIIVRVFRYRLEAL